MSTATRDLFRLHSDLRAQRSFAVSCSAELLRAFDTGHGERVAGLATETFARLEDAAEVLSHLPVLAEGEPLSEATVTRLARLAALAVHAHVGARVQAGRQAQATTPPARVLAAIARAENVYVSALLDSRAACKSGRIARLGRALTACLDLARKDIAFAAVELGGQPEQVRTASAAAVRLAEVARRVAMLSGACLLLMFRLTNARKAAGLSRVAANRARLARPAAPLVTAAPRAQGLAPGSSAWLHLQAQAVAWQEDGDGATRITVDGGDITELRLPRRNLQRVGLAPGSLMVVAGIVAPDPHVLEIGQQPLSRHAGEVWEDYLLTEMRPLYDLRPGSVDMAWDMPEMSLIGARNDLHGRL